MNLLDRAIAVVSPRAGLRRAQARMSLQAMAHYRAGSLPRRSPSVRAVAGDADAVSAVARRQIALSVRDVVRNNAVAERAVQVLVNAVIGTGIEPKLISDDTELRDAWKVQQSLLDTVRIDADGASTLAAMQRLMVRAMIVDGESLMIMPRESGPDSFFQVRVLEADYLDDRMQGRAGNPANTLYDGIEYGPDGRVVAYHLYDEHPGSAVWHPEWRGLTSSRIPADRVIHLYRTDRAGQRRGVSWFAPVLDDLVALAENDEAQMMRQKIAACFAVFWRSDKEGPASGIPSKLAPGMIQQIGSDDEISFATPPDVTGYDDFARVHLRRIAAGLGITYEALTGDLSGVNYSSARIGRMEMAANVEAWQWTLVMPRLCAPMGQWFLRSWAYADPKKVSALSKARIAYTPPPPAVADPKTETQVAVQKIEAGLSSRPAEIRRMGYEPGEIDAEIKADAETRQSLAALKAPSQAAAAQSETDQQERDANA
ncbi:phage portal protein, lambda family [Gemmobacter megaterium]|uniref:Phage portal protein, lambda family n=1 Tax=Gemmobacter megaterium TaxID=1086013 RepID=A0A1N7QJL8_9RHOB|nr:phage portal protein [Gemmobacter megaterium]GGE26652.1 phage portal protein [Gemmobacter megaterium]SIT22707.1 phage portal protein, lambda family [Gemmobacter megaterium]